MECVFFHLKERKCDLLWMNIKRFAWDCLLEWWIIRFITDTVLSWLFDVIFQTWAHWSYFIDVIRPTEDESNSLNTMKPEAFALYFLEPRGYCWTIQRRINDACFCFVNLVCQFSHWPALHSQMVNDSKLPNNHRLFIIIVMWFVHKYLNIKIYSVLMLPPFKIRCIRNQHRKISIQMSEYIILSWF